MTSTNGTRPATAVISGLSIAHGNWSATQAALLGADLKHGTVSVTGFTDRQAAQLAGTSLSYLRLAMQIADVPALRGPVEAGTMSLVAAVQMLQRLQSQPKQPEKKPASALLELFAEASSAERAKCMRAFVGEALELVDASTAPSNGVSKPNGMFAQH